MSQSNFDTVRNALKWLAEGKLDLVLECVADDFKVIEAANLPYGGIYKGREGFAEMARNLTATWQNFSFEINDMFGSDDYVGMLETLKGTVDGRPFEMPVLETWRFRDGKVIEIIPYYHDTALLRDLVAGKIDEATPVFSHAAA